jgi:Transposase DNA-binding/Transposase Tn5 dimerisation domain
MDTWVQDELREADFGDKRLTKRFIRLVSDLAAHPDSSVPQACEDWAATKGAYRFWDHEQVTPESIRAVHYHKTTERSKGYNTVLAVQDTTSLNYTAHRATQRLGPIDGKGSNGMHVHSVLAVSFDGVPLGLLHQEVWARDPNEKGKKEQRKKLPIEEKESYRWLQSLEATEAMMGDNTHIVTVTDREGDIFELFALPRPHNMDLLIRAVQDRRVQADNSDIGKLWDTVESTPASSQTMTTHLEHKPGEPARDVTFRLKWKTISILPPANKKKKYAPVMFTAILVTEEDSPENIEPLQWLLLTTLEVSTFQQAAQCVLWYRFRWLIERYHFVLKSGCHLEKLQLESIERLERALATYCIVAWRLLYLTYLARKTPDVSCDVFFQPHEWKALYAFSYHTSILPSSPPPLHEAIRLVAKLGGFLDRKCDGEPGVQTIWRGLRRLDDLSAMWLLLHSFSPLAAPGSYG